MSYMIERQARVNRQARKKVAHQANELRRGACQLRRIDTPTLTLKAIAGELDRIADKLDRKPLEPGKQLQPAGLG